MPTAAVKSFAGQTGKSVAEVERLWNKTAEIVHEQYGLSDSDGDQYYALRMGVLKKMLRLEDTDSLSATERAIEEAIEELRESGLGLRADELLEIFRMSSRRVA